MPGARVEAHYSSVGEARPGLTRWQALFVHSMTGFMHGTRKSAEQVVGVQVGREPNISGTHAHSEWVLRGIQAAIV